MGRSIIHVDMDAFYASVEQRDNPFLRGKPVLVGGSPGTRGVVSAASYEAREFGARSAMPMSHAVRLCPHAIVLPVRMDHYVRVSRQIHRIFESYTPLVEPISIDEAFLDVTGSLRLFGEAEAIARRLKAEVRKQTQLTASVGLAPSKFLAKLASDLDKPDGIVFVTEEGKLDLLAPLPISRIWGVGKVGQKTLAAMGITTISDLQRFPLDVLEGKFGSSAKTLHDLALGIDDRPVIPEHGAKSISAETTFPRDVSSMSVLDTTLLELAETVAWRLRKAQRVARTAVLKLRYGDFTTITRQARNPQPTDLAEVLFEQVTGLLRTRVALKGREVRLIGLAATGLAEPARRQLSLFDDTQTEKRKRVAQAVDEVREKMGADAIVRGRLLGDEEG